VGGGGLQRTVIRNPVPNYFPNRDVEVGNSKLHPVQFCLFKKELSSFIVSVAEACGKLRVLGGKPHPVRFALSVAFSEWQNRTQCGFTFRD
jgi:hypothetical protein